MPLTLELLRAFAHSLVDHVLDDLTNWQEKIEEPELPGTSIVQNCRNAIAKATNQIERERQEREKGRNENRDRIVEMSERLSDGQRELHEGQKEIAKQLGTVVIAVTEIRGHMETMDSQRDTLASEVERIRDKQNGHAVRRTMGEE